MKPVLLLSDLHLADERANSAGAFHAFAAGPARAAGAVYILGDLFDSWIGDDQLREPFAANIVQALRGIADAGVVLSIARGNRDFLLGEEFARATGATLLAEQAVADLGGVATLLTHGDELCTDDHAYQRYREWMRDPVHRRRLLRLPYRLRRRIAAWMRTRSRSETARKPESILDVNAAAVEEALRRHRVTRIIHGHTHRPARHELVVDGVRCERIVLADWNGRGHYLEIGDEGLRNVDIDG
ncbi:MAG: UDP-2,3-diacylglucosamine diphosphatase [Proteobacteria bacterium]|nr:UDP-2,3-diacylglucosamine diphosphatase [Pseudomonadota bacterium]